MRNLRNAEAFKVCVLAGALLFVVMISPALAAGDGAKLAEQYLNKAPIAYQLTAP